MYTVYTVLIVSIIASQESNTIYKSLPESEIPTESELDKLSEITTDSLEITYNQYIAIKTILLFKVP